MIRLQVMGKTQYYNIARKLGKLPTGDQEAYWAAAGEHSRGCFGVVMSELRAEAAEATARAKAKTKERDVAVK